MIKYGHLDIDVCAATLDQVQFQEVHECYRQYSQLDNYYHKQNSSIWQMFDDHCPEWVQQTARQLLLLPDEQLSYHVVSIIKIDPGNTVPNHVDAHFKVQEKFGIGDTARYLIMLEDWKIGHYYEIHAQPYTKWRAGDWVKFGPGDWHLAGNMGDEPFYSMQVTVKYD